MRVLGPAGVLTDEVLLEKYNTDWTGQFRGRSRLVLQPASTAEVAAVLEYCNQHRCACVILPWLM